MTPEELQRQWQHFLLSFWKAGLHSINNALWRFREYFPDECPQDSSKAVLQWLKDNGVKTLPPESFWYLPIGAWMFAAWPQLVDEIAKVKDAKTIDLSKLKFIPNPKPTRSQIATPKRATQRLRAEMSVESMCMHIKRKGSQNKLGRR